MAYETFSAMLGKTMKSVVKTSEEMVFTDMDGKEYVFFHEQDCCESVWIEDVAGDLPDLEGSPILQAEETFENDPSVESGTWTFYKFATVKGYVTVRWYGSSNGQYSEGVNFRVR